MGQIDLDGSNSTVKADVIRGQTGTTVKLGGVLDTDGNYVQSEKGGDLTSASPLVIDTDGSYFDVTGTTNFAAMTVAADRQFTLQFDGVLTMTHHATNLDLPGEANITTAAGDVATFQSTASNTVQCINYTRADGTAVVSATETVQAVVFEFATDTETGNGKYYFHIPASMNGMNLVTVHAEVITAGTTNTTNIQIHNATDGQDMLSTGLTIDSTETGSDTAATPAVINASYDDVATNDVIRIDVDQVSSTAAKGLLVTMEFRLP